MIPAAQQVDTLPTQNLLLDLNQIAWVQPSTPSLNSFANSAQGFTKFIPSLLSMLTIIFCMYCLSQVMKSIPVGITYASFAGLCIIATVLIGIIKFNQMPNIYSFIGLILIISGVLIVNLLGKLV